MIRSLVVAAVFAAAPAMADGFTAPVAAKTRPMVFEAPVGGPLVFRGAVAISPPERWFGGLSGIAMEGPRITLGISDTGVWFRLALRIESGRLVGVNSISTAPMLGADGKATPRGARDAEGLARDPETGRLWVSYEGYHRIWEFDTPGGPALRGLLHPDWTHFSENNGIEALARDADGRLWAIGEGGGASAFTIWFGGREGWDIKHLPKRGPYSPTGADFGPDGWLYVTERAFSFFGGFRFRLRRFRWDEGAAPIEEETLLALGAETSIDNIESVVLWREAGQTYLLLASDDNFMPFERNVLALFEVVD